MIQFVFGKIMHLWIMENRLESERPLKNTLGMFCMAWQTQKRRKCSSASGRLPDLTEARVQGADTCCVSGGCRASVLQVRTRSDTGLWGAGRAGGGQGGGTGSGLGTHQGAAGTGGQSAPGFPQGGGESAAGRASQRSSSCG